jgi:hypothetical protein
MCTRPLPLEASAAGIVFDRSRLSRERSPPSGEVVGEKATARREEGLGERGDREVDDADLGAGRG